MTRTVFAATTAAAAALATTATLATTPAGATTPTAGKTRAVLIVAVHTDDEVTLSTQWVNRPNELKVLLWLDETTGGRYRRVNPTTGRPIGHDIGERYNPLNHPGGFTSGYFRGSLMNLTAMRAADPSLPRLIYDQPTKEFRDSGRDVTVWSNPGRGHAIAYRHKMRDVTPTTTRQAINDVTTNPAKYGLPTNLTWTDLIASNYYNRSGAAGAVCDPYANPYHGHANTGVSRYAYPQFTGRKMYPICKTDPASAKSHATVTGAVAQVAYGGPDGLHGTISHHFGWLYTGRLRTPATRSGVFGKQQWYAHGPARAGHPR